MLSLLLISSFSSLPPIQGIYELSFGSMYIECLHYTSENSNSPEKTYYSVNISESDKVTKLTGQLYQNTIGGRMEFVNNVSLIFDQNKNNTCTFMLGDESIAEFVFERSGNGLLFYVGKFLNQDASYSATLLSYKAMEIVVKDGKESYIYRILRDVDGMEGTESSLGRMILPIALVVLFMLQRKRNGSPDKIEQQN